MRANGRCLIGVVVGLALCAFTFVAVERSSISALDATDAMAAVGGEACTLGRPKADFDCPKVVASNCPWFFGTCSNYRCGYNCKQVVVKGGGTPDAYSDLQTDDCEDVAEESCVQGFIICICTTPTTNRACGTYTGADISPFCRRRTCLPRSMPQGADVWLRAVRAPGHAV